MKHRFSSADLPGELTHAARYDLWRDIHYSEVAAVEFGISERPFEATLEATILGDLTYGKMSGTVNKVVRTPHSIRQDTSDKYLLVMNLGDTVIGGRYRDTDINMKFGSGFLDGSQPQEFYGSDTNVWVNLALPRKLMNDQFARIEETQGRLIDASSEPLTLLRNYLAMLDMSPLGPDGALAAHVQGTIVDLVGLATGAKGDAAELAGMRGLKAARLQSVLNIMKKNYRNPALSAPTVALQLGLSPRYVQDLLASTGMGFSDRILEMRLQDAKAMLADRRRDDRKIGDIAFDVGFGDVSYFNRSFKRRFGCSPRAAR